MVGQKEYDYESSKKILLFNALHGIHERWQLKPGNDEFQNRKCQVDNCYITENKYQLGNNKLSVHRMVFRIHNPESQMFSVNMDGNSIK